MKPGMRLVHTLWLVGLLGLTGCATSIIRSARPLPDDVIRPVVAVSSFDNRSSFSGQWKLGSGMADLVVSELVRSENFIVVERGHFLIAE